MTTFDFFRFDPILGDITGFKGTFNGFELCFTSESENLDTLKLNTCQVKDGELEIISETENVDQQAGLVQQHLHQTSSNNAVGGKVAGIWNLLIKWNMQGLDVKVGFHINIQFSFVETFNQLKAAWNLKV